MLIIDNNSVYEIDEDCLKRKKVPKECGTVEIVEELRQKGKRYPMRDSKVKKL